MNTNKLHGAIRLRSFLVSLLLAALGFLPTASVQAEHDHDHIFVTLVKNFGYDSDSEIHKVQVSTGNNSYIISLHGTLSTIAGHMGERARISVNSKGVWTDFAVVDHRGSARIHTVKRL